MGKREDNAREKELRAQAMRRAYLFDESETIQTIADRFGVTYGEASTAIKPVARPNRATQRLSPEEAKRRELERKRKRERKKPPAGYVEPPQGSVNNVHGAFGRAKNRRPLDANWDPPSFLDD